MEGKSEARRKEKKIGLAIKPEKGIIMAKQGKKTSKIRRLLLNIGKLVLDATKLCFGSLVLGAAINGEIPTAILMLVGVIASTIGAVSGILLVTFAEEK